MRIYEITEGVKQRLDAKCWKGYKKQGTKIKGGVRVNNCVKEDISLDEQFDAIEMMVEHIAKAHGVDPEVVWEDFESIDDDSLYAICEDWQKVNRKDKTDGMSKKAVNAYRRENPGSKLKTAVTTKPSKLKKGSKASKRRKSFCARSDGQKKMHNIDCSKDLDKAICKARRRWNCESLEQEFVTEYANIPNHFIDRLKKQGYKLLGQGVDQAAFTVPNNPKLVLKIFGANEQGHEMFMRWAKFCQKNPNNPYLPKFGGFEKVNIDGEDYIMMYQERLAHSNGGSEVIAAAMGIAMITKWRKHPIRGNDPAGYQKSWDRDTETLKKNGVNVELFQKTAAQLLDLGDRYGYDFDLYNPQNIMLRSNGQPVIVDPWA